MPEPRTFVTDTHPLVFHAAGGKRLGRAAARIFRAAEDGEALVFVPAVVLWEIGLLARRGRIRLGRTLAEFAADLFSNPSYQAVDVSRQHVCLADERRPNEDPFDGLICAVAMELKLPLLTADAEIEASGLVKTVW